MRNLGLILSIVMFFILGREQAFSGQRYWVSVDGNDANAGSEAQPFKTLEQARDAVRAVGVRSAENRATVMIKGGIYPRTKTFELDQRDSFTTYIAAPDETVRVIGGVSIPFSAVSTVTDAAILSRVIEKEAWGKIKQINLKALGITNYGELGPRGFRRPYIPSPLEIVIDDQVLQIARWPNAGEADIPIKKVITMGSVPRKGDYGLIPGTFVYESKRPEMWTQADDLYVSGVFGAEWADDTIKVAKLDTRKGTFTTTLPHLYGFYSSPHTRWHGLNLLEEIDVPGEYYIDKPNGILYFYPPQTYSGQSKIFVSTLDKPMIAIENAEHVTIKNLICEITRDSAVYIEGGKQNTLVGCTLRNIGGLAIQFGQGAEPYPQGLYDGTGNRADGKFGVPASRIMGSWNEHIYQATAWNRKAGTDHSVINCKIYDAGAGGIMLGGGDRKTLTPGNNTVTNCDIYRVNRWDLTYRAPINMDGVGQKIVNNHLHDGSGAGIYFHGNDHIIEYNELDHLCKSSSDMGAIYMGRDPSETGHLIRYNFIHDVKGSGGSVMGVYFDDCAVYAGDVVGNVFFNVGKNQVIQINGGSGGVIRNNIVIDCSKKFINGANVSSNRCVEYMKSEMGLDRLTKNVDVTQPPYSVKYPKLLAAFKDHVYEDTKVESNYIIHPAKGEGDLSQFVDPARLNFKLKEDAKVYTELEGFKPIPFEKIGVRN